jgi:hypothetical protein
MLPGEEIGYRLFSSPGVVSPRLERLQIFEQFLLGLIRQLSAVGVGLITVSLFSRVEKKIRLV